VQVLHDYHGPIPGSDRSIMTIGTYDGIHHGHRRIISEVVSRCHDSGLSSVVVSFDRHPLSVLRPEAAPLMLTGAQQKAELIQALGVDYLYLLTFDQRRSLQSARDFVYDVVVNGVRAKEVHVGSNFRFGHQRQGDVEFLAEVGTLEDFEVYAAGLSKVSEVLGENHRDADKAISSTLVRKMVTAAELQDASALLHRFHSVRGVVVGGDQRGSGELGFPTANLEIPANMAVPHDGVYAGTLRPLSGQRSHLAAISIGTRPTFYPSGGPRLIESFVLDYNGNLYGEEVEVAFVEFLRPQIAYESSDELIAQIHLDVAAVRDKLTLQ
jgi:riboflavin kinase/FMN adenylyltransferase